MKYNKLSVEIEKIVSKFEEEQIRSGNKKTIIFDFVEEEINKNNLDLKIYYKSNSNLNLLEGGYSFLDELKKMIDGFEFDFLDVNKIIRIDLYLCDISEKDRFIDKLRSLKNAKKLEDKGNDKGKCYSLTKPKYKFENLIISEGLRIEIEDCIGLIKHSDLIYNVWGFKKIDPVAKSIVNLYGPPGTGKTMAAHAIADKLDKPFLALNYSEIESKFVGEAPKNLSTAFEQGKSLDAVLFFDEADSFLGKRIENVSNGSDQAINSLRSQMLILLEDYPGVVIFSTNLVSNFDKAFESRILRHLHFDLPDFEARKNIIKSMLPKELPIQNFLEEDFETLAKSCEGFSGREIKNCILQALLKKANQDGKNSVFTFSDFMEAFKSKEIEKIKLKTESDLVLKSKIQNATKRKIDEQKREELILLCKIGFHVIWADGTVNALENEAVNSFIFANNLNLELPKSIDDLDSLDDLISKEFTENQKSNLLDFMIKLLNVSHDPTDLSINKVKEVMSIVGLNEKNSAKLNDYLEKVKSISFEFRDILSNLN